MPHDVITSLPLLLAAAFFAGALNAVAGGGSFLTFPALVLSGVAPVAANATGTIALLPGYLSSSWAYRDDMRQITRDSLRRLVALSLVGGALGAALLLVTPNDTFRRVVPWLLLAATALFAAGPWLLAHVKRDGEAGAAAHALGVLAVSCYGGYFNGGLGIMLLALFGMLGHTQLNRMNGLKNLLSSVLTAIACSLYAWGGAIAWREALAMMLAATLGGYVGGRVGRRIPARLLRVAIVLVGLGMALLFFLR